MYPKPGHPEILQSPSFTKNSGLPWTAQRAPGLKKTTRLDRKMRQSGSRHPGLFQSSQATVLELWVVGALEGPPWTQLDSVWSHPQTPQKHRKQPDLTAKCFNPEVVIQASSRALRPPFWSSSLPLTSRDLLGRNLTLLEPTGDAPEAQKTTRHDRKMPQSGSRYLGLFQSSQATSGALGFS